MTNPFGPIARFDLVRIARRQRITLFRCVYALGLALIAATTYWAATRNWTVRTRPQEIARITAGLFYGLFAVQFVLVVATPNWTADAIAGEKERRTLPFLLLTPLGDWQIVLGKLIARLAQVGLFVLAGIPVLCALQFFGGVDPLLVLIGYVVLGVSVLSLGSLAILSSVYARTTRQAGQVAARNVAGYIFAMYALTSTFGRWPPPAYIRTIVEWLNAGNPLQLAHTLTNVIRGGGHVGDVLLPAVGQYVVFHLVATGVFLAWASARLRPVAAEQGEGPPPPKSTGLMRPPPRPPVTDRPVLWKGMYFDARQTRSMLGARIARIVFVLSFLPTIIVIVETAISGDWRGLPTIMNASIIRGLCTAVLCGVLVMIAANTSAAFAVERRKKTLDELLLTDLSNEEILGQKWWASIVVIRWALVWVGVHWLIGLVARALHPLAVPLLMAEWTAYAAFGASLGLYCAARWPSARTAGIYTGVFGFLLTMAPLFLSGLVGIVERGESGWFLLPATISPPVALGVSAFSANDLVNLRGHPGEVRLALFGCLASVSFYGCLAWRLWLGACRRFSRAVG
jgi:ABC-type Na+ efflux pump permease subunit